MHATNVQPQGKEGPRRKKKVSGRGGQTRKEGTNERKSSDGKKREREREPATLGEKGERSAAERIERGKEEEELSVMEKGEEEEEKEEEVEEEEEEEEMVENEKRRGAEVPGVAALSSHVPALS